MTLLISMLQAFLCLVLLFGTVIVYKLIKKLTDIVIFGGAGVTTFLVAVLIIVFVVEKRAKKDD
ncbi:hypothetical protein P4639_14415 [Priestia megaterium]|uniref:hypothetical protein n=1 Tax=Priestia megaterium TaxID=1404 RepID=UPI002E1BFFCF|nr:hypothetical protein [Priestia megaterium]